MTLTHRRIIYSFFIAVFLVATWIIILRVSGYQYDFGSKSWQKTGMLFLETKPEIVDVYLNDQLIGQKTPLRIKDLLPNKYTLRIEKKDWGSWQKEIQIDAGQTNTIQYVRIFREQEIPKNIITGEIVKTVISPDQNNALILKQGAKGVETLSLVDLNNDTEREIKKIIEPVEKIQFIDNGTRAAVLTKNNVYLISLNSSGSAVDLGEQVPGRKIDNIKLSDNNSENVYYQSDGQLMSYNWLLKKEAVVLPHYPIDYLPGGDKIYFLSSETLGSVSLKVWDLQNKKEPETLAVWPEGQYALLTLENNFLTAQSAEDLLVFDLSTQKSEVVRGGKYALWSQSQTEMLFGDDYELWAYRPLEKKDKYLILTRAGEVVGASAWYPPESHIFYAESGTIKILENIEANRLTVILGKFTAVEQIFINKKGDKLFFVGTVGKIKGFYELDIQ